MLILYFPSYFDATNEGYLFTAIKDRHDRHPQLVKGDLLHHLAITSRSPHAQSRTCFVLTYDREISDDLARDHIDEFERVLLPGFDGRYSSYWVRHTEPGKFGPRTALHGEIATTEFDSGYRIQPFHFARDWSRLMLLQGVLNARHGFADPTIPQHGSWVRLTGPHKDVQQLMAHQLLAQAEHSGDTDADALDVLQHALGYHAKRINPRHGRPFIRCVHEDLRVDLHGRLYSPTGLSEYLAAKPEDRALSAASSDIRPNAARAQALQAQLDSHVARQRNANELTLARWSKPSETENPTATPTHPALPSLGPANEQFVELITRALLPPEPHKKPTPITNPSHHHEEEEEYAGTATDRPVGDERTPPSSSPGIRGGTARLGVPFQRACHSLRTASQAVDHALDRCGRARHAVQSGFACIAGLDRAMRGLSGSLDTADAGCRELSGETNSAFERLGEALSRWTEIQRRVTAKAVPCEPSAQTTGDSKEALLAQLDHAAGQVESLNRKDTPNI